MAKKKKSYLKNFTYNSNPYILTEEGNQQSREVAFKYIYSIKREDYPLRFRDYVVHHIDGDTFNNSVRNLYLCSKKDHNLIHEEQKKTKKKFQNSREINFFLKSKIPQNQTKLGDWKTKKFIESSPKYSKISRNKKNLSQEMKIIKTKLSNKPSTKFLYPKRTNPFIETTPKKKKKILNIFLIGLIIFAILVLIFSFSIFKQDNLEDIKNMEKSQVIIPSSIIVEGSKTAVLINNSWERDVSINVTYRIYSNWFGIDSIESRIFEVKANSQESFNVYNNYGCDTAPCSVSILNFEEI
jgi:hypothetical protein